MRAPDPTLSIDGRERPGAAPAPPPGGAPGAPLAPADRRALARDAALVAVVAFAAHFALFRRFGLYEDDYAFVALALRWTWGDALAWAESCFRSLPQGRPIGFFLNSIVPFLCFRLGGLAALPLVYLAGAAIVCLNAVLAHRLLARAYGRSFGLLGGLFFTLYPADTTHPLLTHALQLQPALTFCLLALLAWQRGRRVLPYALAACALFTYETGVLAFFAAPLLSGPWDRRLVRRWAVHVGVVCAIVLGAVLLRRATGEARVAELSGGWGTVLSRIPKAVVIGAAASLEAFSRRTGYALRQLGPQQLFPAALAAAAVLAAAFARRSADAPLERRTLGRALATGLVMLGGGYGLAFSNDHYPPIERAGRLTSVHMGATLGAAMVAAALVSLLWAAARARRPARLAAAGVAALFVASLFAFHLAVQRGFAASAEAQRRYWTRLLELVPDLGPGGLVVLLSAEPAASEFILTSSWADIAVLPLLVDAGAGPAPALVGGTAPFDPSFVEARGGELWWSARAPGWLYVDRSAPVPRELFVLERGPAGWVRRTGAITWSGVTRELPPPRAGAVPLARGPLDPLLVVRSSSRR